jgi:protein transport protein SEC20
MSFESISERLAALQESNQQLKTLIERLATIKFQPGSVPLDNEEDNAMAELTSEIHQTIKDQDEDFELLQEEIFDLDTGRPKSELEQQRDNLAQLTKRSIKELRLYVSQLCPLTMPKF